MDSRFALIGRACERTWDAATLHVYLEDPRGSLQGTRMVYAGLKDAKQLGLRRHRQV